MKTITINHLESKCLPTSMWQAGYRSNFIDAISPTGGVIGT